MSKCWRKVYFAKEDVQFYQLRHESKLQQPKDCFLTSWSMIRYILCLLNLLGSIATGIYAISMEDAKLQNLIAEPVIFLLRVAINKALPVTSQSLASFVYKIKNIQTERYDLLPKNCLGFGAKM